MSLNANFARKSRYKSAEFARKSKYKKCWL